MAIDVPYHAELAMAGIQFVIERRVIRQITPVDPALQLDGGEAARVQGYAAVGQPPYEADPELGLARRRERMRPRVGQQRGIDVVETAIRVDVGPRKTRLDQRRAMLRRGAIEPRHVRVLGLPHDGARRHMVEIVRIILARMR